MKKTNRLLFLAFLFAFLQTSAQPTIFNDPHVHAALKKAVSREPGWRVFGNRTGPDFINMAVVHEPSKSLYWFNCYGRLFDSTGLTQQQYEDIVSGKTDVFQSYRKMMDSILHCIEDIKMKYRLLGISGAGKFQTVGNRAALPSIRGVNFLEEILALEQEQMVFRSQLAIANLRQCDLTNAAKQTMVDRRLLGAMLKGKDSTLFVAADPFAGLPAISLRKNDPLLRVYNREGNLVDSLNVVNNALLLTQKVNPFDLYRVWLERRYQWLLKEIRQVQQVQVAYRLNQFHRARYLELSLRLTKQFEELNRLEKQIERTISQDASALQQALQQQYQGQRVAYFYMSGLGVGYSSTFTRGEKRYELTNHLGNVLATVSDRKIPHSSDGVTIDYYNADVVSAQDYYPFGSIQPGRSFNAGGYRYGFNGKENDNEVKGDGNQQDYGMRIYDTRLGRFLSVDPITKKYPQLTPYQFASNRPIDGVDQDGKEWSTTKKYDPATGITSVEFHTVLKIYNGSSLSMREANKIGKEYQNAIVRSFSGLYDEEHKISYSASANVMVIQGDNIPSTGYNVVLRDVKAIPGKSFFAGASYQVNSQENLSWVAAATIDPATGTIQAREPNMVALSILHENGHTAGLSHLFDPENTAADVDLTPTQITVNGKIMDTYTVSPGASRDRILKNVMNYTSTTIDGKKVRSLIKNSRYLNSFSPDQANLIREQIIRDLNGKDAKPVNTTPATSNRDSKPTSTDTSNN